MGVGVEVFFFKYVGEISGIFPRQIRFSAFLRGAQFPLNLYKKYIYIGKKREKKERREEMHSPIPFPPLSLSPPSLPNSHTSLLAFLVFCFVFGR